MPSVELFTVRAASWDTDRADLTHLRRTVFIEEQRVPEHEEWDSADPVSIHALACTANRDAVGTGRLEPLGKIGRIAVLTTHRGIGVGARILRWLIEEAARRGLKAVYLHAQTHALPFYQRFGFVAEGAVFDEVGIPHQLMRLELSTHDRPREEAQRHGKPHDPDHPR
ncbi:MAG: GNAT family N-acetyltransferase [Steroidobacteraceae bacterium]